jgi:hypothetical protein
MRSLKVLLGVAAVGAIALALRDFQNRRWLAPAVPGGLLPRGGGGGLALLEEDEEEYAEEPVLGYDGMDRDTLVEWLGEADLDEATLLRIQRYEEANLNREPVLDAVGDLLASFG